MTDNPVNGQETSPEPEADSRAYQVKLDQFEGPLDLLLFLIKQEEINIYDIPIARITEQYLSYIQRIPIPDLESAGEFLLMAATLMRIKARMLLPKISDGEETEEDPRQELVDRLLEYQKFKEAATTLKGLETDRSLFFARGARESLPETDEAPELEPATLFDLMRAFSTVLERARHHEAHAVVQEGYSIEKVAGEILARLETHPQILFEDLFEGEATRLRVVVVFVALLDLVRKRRVDIGQTRRFGEIWIERRDPLPE
jgi:segregation and condensation protein A